MTSAVRGAPRELRVEVVPAAPYRLPLRGGMDGVLRRRGTVLERLLHHGEEPVRVRVAQTAAGRVVFGAQARSAQAARHGIQRMRFALGVDDDLGDFHRLFAHDPLIGRSVGRRPWLRVTRRPEPFEALAWAICEQLIEYERAAAIQRRIVRRLGRAWALDAPVCSARFEKVRPAIGGGPGNIAKGRQWHDGRSERPLLDVPSAETIAATAPAMLESFDLSGSRARLLVRVAREVARGRLDLHDEGEQECGWRRLRAMAGVGPWTVEMLALKGQGRYDQLPAGDLGLIKLVGRYLSGGDPRARATEDEVRAFFAPYGRWAGLAAVHTLAL